MVGGSGVCYVSVFPYVWAWLWGHWFGMGWVDVKVVGFGWVGCGEVAVWQISPLMDRLVGVGCAQQSSGNFVGVLVVPL